jgi:hypothetical protein
MLAGGRRVQRLVGLRLDSVRALALPPLGEVPRSMQERDNDNAVSFDAIEESVMVDEDLAKRGVRGLRPDY